MSQHLFRSLSSFGLQPGLEPEPSGSRQTDARPNWACANTCYFITVTALTHGGSIKFLLYTQSKLCSQSCTVRRRGEQRLLANAKVHCRKQFDRNMQEMRESGSGNASCIVTGVGGAKGNHMRPQREKGRRFKASS